MYYITVYKIGIMAMFKTVQNNHLSEICNSSQKWWDNALLSPSKFILHVK